MVNLKIPTSSDVYLEVNGTKLAVVEGYRVYSTKDSYNVEAFGQTEPVATLSGKTKHHIELSRVYIDADATSYIDFYGLNNFNFVIVKPKKRIVYSGCEWDEINEKATLNDTILEGVKILATKRIVLNN